jgi:hypothetical protein
MDVDAALQSQIRNIEATYGKPLDHWFAVIDASGLTKHNQVVAMLKTDHGLAHGAAHRLSLLARSCRRQRQRPAGWSQRPSSTRCSPTASASARPPTSTTSSTAGSPPPTHSPGSRPHFTPFLPADHAGPQY